VKEEISQIPLFEGICRETLEKLCTYGEICRMDKGSICFRAKEVTPNVYILLNGQAIIYNLTHQGQRKIIYILGNGELLSENIMADHSPGTFCEIIKSSDVFSIRKSYFRELMKKDYRLTENVLSAYERNIWRLSHQLKNTTGSTNLEKKLAAKLWKLSRDFGKKTADGILIDINLSVTFLADLMGAPRETISRMCKNLVNKELIQMERKQITIINPEGLVHFYKKE
jgi:CRP-like cAMP-binding protein